MDVEAASSGTLKTWTRRWAIETRRKFEVGAYERE